jgi:hypothetical protein
MLAKVASWQCCRSQRFTLDQREEPHMVSQSWGSVAIAAAEMGGSVCASGVGFLGGLALKWASHASLGTSPVAVSGGGCVATPSLELAWAGVGWPAGSPMRGAASARASVEGILLVKVAPLRPCAVRLENVCAVFLLGGCITFRRKVVQHAVVGVRMRGFVVFGAGCACGWASTFTGLASIAAGLICFRAFCRLLCGAGPAVTSRELLAGAGSGSAAYACMVSCPFLYIVGGSTGRAVSENRWKAVTLRPSRGMSLVLLLRAGAGWPIGVPWRSWVRAFTACLCLPFMAEWEIWIPCRWRCSASLDAWTRWSPSGRSSWAILVIPRSHKAVRVALGRWVWRALFAQDSGSDSSRDASEESPCARGAWLGSP